MNADLAVSLMGLKNKNIVGPVVSNMSYINDKIDDEKAQRIADINNIVAIHSTDTERLAAVAALTAAFEADDATVIQTLTNTISAETSARQLADTGLQNQINGNDTDILANSQGVATNAGDISTSDASITAITQKLGTVTGAEFGVLLGVGTSTSLATQLAQRVALTGNQSVAGQKTFTDATTFSSTIEATSVAGSTEWAGVVIPANKLTLTSKQDVIGDGDLSIARTSGLQTELDGKQPTIGTDDLAISDVQNLTTQLAAKQPTIGTDDLAISHVQNLSTQLAAKQPTIGTDDLAISHVQNLTTQLAAKQSTIGTDDLAISDVQNLTTQLAAKQPTIGDGDLSIARTTGLQTAIDSKQATIGYEHLSIAMTSGLQTAIDGKQPTIGTDALAISHVQNLTTQLAALAPKASPVFTGTSMLATVLVSGQSTFSDDVAVSADLVLSNAGKLILNNSGNGEAANSYADDLQVYKYNGAGITIGSPQGKINSLAFADQNHANRNLIRAYSTVADSRNVGMHCFSNQADTEVPSLSITDGLIGINKAQPAAALDVVGNVEITGNVNLAAGKEYKVNGTAIGGVDEAANYDFTGNHSYDGSHIRITHHLDDSADYAYDADDSAQNLSKDISSYFFYRVPTTHTDSTKHHLFLPSDAPIGCRIGVHTFGKGYSARNKVNVGCQSENDRMYSKGGSSNLNGWRSGSKSSNSSHYIEIKSSDRKYFVCVHIDTTDSNSRWWIA
jgi:hypothetical protein